MSKEQIIKEKTTKSGKKVLIDLRALLSSLSLIEYEESMVTIAYEGSCRNDGNNLQPSNVVWIIELISGKTFELEKIHRQALVLA